MWTPCLFPPLYFIVHCAWVLGFLRVRTQAARQYRRALRRAAWYAAGGTLGALALYGLIRLQQRSRAAQQHARGAVPSPGAELGAELKSAVSQDSIKFR